MTYSRSIFLSVVTAVISAQITSAFTATTSSFRTSVGIVHHKKSTLFNGFDDFTQETPENTKERIQEIVDNNPVVVFMKGSKLFPQCGFSNTACQILQSFDLDFHSVDVLADEAIRTGVKDFSEWPTIPQLYVCGEFIGGSDIMIEMYQSGELGEMIEKAKADMV
mmetsp:Transcript_51476/g.52458  ORF Transcript_51476/g.52458 Transcript_51476/m.52458 type:complete len:165 (-) Transcript_51476:1365-1859(-)